MVVTLYKLDGSPPSRGVLMTVDIIGISIDTIDVDTMQGDQYKPEFVEKNPLHTIPVLEDDDFILADSHAIATYLVSKYGADKRSVLYPVDLRQRAIIDQRFFFDASIVFPLIQSIVKTVAKLNQPGPSQEEIARAGEVYGYLEKYLDRSPFLAGEHITLADITLVATVSTLDALVPLADEYVKVREWWDKLRTKDWYQTGNQPGLTQFTQFLQHCMQKKSTASSN